MKHKNGGRRWVARYRECSETQRRAGLKAGFKKERKT